MLVKDGIAYLQAGVSLSGLGGLGVLTRANDLSQGGIVFDSDPYDEWMETINKLGEFVMLRHHVVGPRARVADGTGANTHCITSAEEKHLAEQREGQGQ